MTAALGVSEQDSVGYRMRNALAKSCSLVAEAQRLQTSAREIRRSSRSYRERLRRPAGDGVSFTFLGVVDGRDVRADWTPRGLRGSDSLLTRADLVVRLGDSFDGPNGTTVPASLAGTPAQALLTLLRASDEVRDVSVVLPRSPRAGGDGWEDDGDEEGALSEPSDLPQAP